MDEIAAPADGDTDATAVGGAKGPVRAYHEAVLSQRQPKVTDLLPIRPLWVFVLLLVGLTGIATIEAIHVHAVSLPAIEGAELLAPLNADSPGSLGAWYSSALLAAAAVLAIVIFSIRAHRIDDYRGRYRIWLWTAGALAWLSLDTATGIHNTIGFALTLVTGQQVVTSSLAAGSVLTWVAVYSLIFGGLGLRLVFELWSSRLSLTALLAAGFLYCDAALLELEMVQTPVSLIAGTIESTLAMLGHFSLLAMVTFYARHVVLDAAGRLKVSIDSERKSKSKRTKLKVAKPRVAAAEQTTSNTATKPQPSAASSGMSASGSQNSASGSMVKPGVAITKNNLTSPDEYEDEDDDEDYGGGNISKSERRRLKKLARREQQRRAA